MLGKRCEVESNIELWFLLGAFLLAAFAGVGLLMETADRIEGTLLEKNFIARDLAMTLEALYAAPGEVARYEYNLGSFRYFIDIEGNKVMAKDKIDDNRPVSYRYAGVHGGRFLLLNYKTINVRSEDCLKGSKLILSKVNHDDGTSEILIEGKNTVICRELDEGCKDGEVTCDE